MGTTRFGIGLFLILGKALRACPYLDASAQTGSIAVSNFITSVVVAIVVDIVVDAIFG